MLRHKNINKFIFISVFLHIVLILGLALVFKSEARVAISKIYEVTTIRFSSKKTERKEAITSKPDTGKLEIKNSKSQPIPKFQKSIKTPTNIVLNHKKPETIEITYKEKAIDKDYDKPLQAQSNITEDAYPDYSSNPKPHYPLIARRRGYEGTVLLKVYVLENGKVGKINLEQSSKYKVLDSAAIKAVNKWSFIPRRRNGVKLASWVKVPIKFRLNDY